MTAAADCRDLQGISDLLGFAPQHIFFLVEKSESLYTSIQLPKRSNPETFREIDIPYTDLKGVQRAILKRILNEIPVSEYAYSYVKRRSIVEAAIKLCGKRAVLKLDIRDFFPSISNRRIFGLYRSLGFNNKVAFILTRLTTYKGRLCQGSPTSPYLSNLITRRLDYQLEKAARSWSIGYLRYSDDLFFTKASNFNHGVFTRMAEEIVMNNGFRLNTEKTRFHPRGFPRRTLGLLTHGRKPQIPGPARRRMRAAFFKASRNVHWARENVSYLRGLLEWHKCVYGKDQRYSQYRVVLNSILMMKVHQTYQSN